ARRAVDTHGIACLVVRCEGPRWRSAVKLLQAFRQAFGTNLGLRLRLHGAVSSGERQACRDAVDGLHLQYVDDGRTGEAGWLTPRCTQSAARDWHTLTDAVRSAGDQVVGL